MSKKIYPGSACRLEFIVEDADGLPVPSMGHADVSSSAYRNRTNGVQSSATTATVTSSVASTAAVSAGQFVTIDSSRGHYAIDVASGAAGSTLDYAEAVVAFTAGHTVTPIQHEIDETLYSLSANLGTIEGIIDATSTDVHDIQARLPAALISGRMDSDMQAINSATASAVRLALSAGVIIPGTVSNAVLTPTVALFAADDISEATATHFNGRRIIFTSGALIGQATAITGFTRVSSEGRFAVVAMTEAPENNDTFIII